VDVAQRNYCFVILLLLFTGILVLIVNLRKGYSARDIGKIKLPLEIGAWKGREIDYDKKAFQVLGADVTIFREYSRYGNGEVTLYLAYYQDMSKADLSHSLEICYPGQGWQIVKQETQLLYLDNGESILVNRMIVQKHREKQLVIYWFQSREGAFARRGAQKFSLILDRLRGRRNDSVFVIVSSFIVDDNVKEVWNTERGFTQELFPLLADIFVND